MGKRSGKAKVHCEFDPSKCVIRNEESARLMFGSLLDDNRRVKGTNIYFDEMWRYHTD